MLSPVHSRSVGDDIVGQIVDLIRSGVLREGDFLPSERALADQLQVSRPTVSQALGRLIELGVLKNGTGRQGNSQVVSRWVPAKVSSASDASRLSEDEVFRLLEARRAVEPRIAQLAAMRATASDFAEMQDSIELLRLNSEDLVKAAQAELLFHRTMWRAARNRPLEQMMVSLFRELSSAHDLMLRTPGDYDEGIRLHDLTLRALKRGDPDEIESVMITHLRHFEQIVEDVYGRSSTRLVPAFLRG